MRRWLARRLYWVSGLLAHIKTPQRHYRVVSFDPFVTEPEPRRTWHSAQFSYRVLTWAMHLDWVHWPHWGLEHKDCLAGPHETCSVCGGVICDYGMDDDEETT